MKESVVYTLGSKFPVRGEDVSVSLWWKNGLPSVTALRLPHSTPITDGTHRVRQCFSTAGPRPGTGPWHQLYRAARGL